MASQLASDRDESMPDPPDATISPQVEDDEDQQRIKIIGPSGSTAATFQFEGEDHTLGNVLRYIVMKKYSPEVELCGYSIPHPAEAKMHLRIQTYGSITVYEALEKGLDDLRALCGIVEQKFETARDQFDVQQQSSE